MSKRRSNPAELRQCFTTLPTFQHRPFISLSSESNIFAGYEQPFQGLSAVTREGD
jgi:hypothetical protein